MTASTEMKAETTAWDLFISVYSSQVSASSDEERHVSIAKDLVSAMLMCAGGSAAGSSCGAGMIGSSFLKRLITETKQKKKSFA